MVGDIFFDRLLQVGNALKDSPANALIGDPGKETLDLIKPTAVRWGKMKFPARMFSQPVLHRFGLMRGVVVEDDMHIKLSGNLALDLTQKIEEFFGAVFGLGGADHLARCYIQSRKQGQRAVPIIVVGSCILSSLTRRGAPLRGRSLNPAVRFFRNR